VVAVSARSRSRAGKAWGGVQEVLGCNGVLQKGGLLGQFRARKPSGGRESKLGAGLRTG